MALSLGQTGTTDSVDAEYFNWESNDRRFMIHMHLDAIDGLVRDVIEGVAAEVGGVLLGQVGRGERPVVWIERYQRVDLDHRPGPEFVLNAEGHAAFEKAARSVSEDGELTVVGYYRAHLRPGFQLEDSDRELLGRYFTDAEDLVLLLWPEKDRVRILAQFIGREADLESGFQILGPAFPFRGRVSGSAEAEDDTAERTGRTVREPAPAVPGAVGHRRLVPDFQPAPESPRPAREFFMEARPAAAPLPEPWESSRGSRFPAKWWPFLAALLLVGAAAAVMVQQSSRHETVEVRPLGLYVDPSGQSWRVSWNTSATVVPPGSRVKLFVRDGDQNQIDLQPQDVQSGTYLYTAKGRDVTFRLEVLDQDGRLSAESFRLMEPVPVPPVAAPASALPEKPAVAVKAGSHFTVAKAIRRVAPVVPGSVRPHIHGSIPLDVRVKIDAHGRVISAVPVSTPRSGVESLLATRAVYAAKQWRFEPARKDGKAVTGTEIIHFVFDK